MGNYNLTLLGESDGMFYQLHVAGLVCIFSSLSCSIVVVTLSFKTHTKSFYAWSKSERFVVYLAVCEGCFNFMHTFDHMTMVISKDHVYPLQLCQFYAFIMIVFGTTKNLVLVVIAVNAFLLIRFQSQMEFGTRDWRLLLIALACPITICVLAVSLDQLGPTGAFCLVRPGLATLLLTIVPFFCIFTVNTTLYTLTWYYIRKDAKRIQSAIGDQAQSASAYVQAAKTMTMFITVFTVQWWAVCTYGVWQIVTDHVPTFVHLLVVIFTNIGGCLNAIVFIRIQRKRTKVAAINTKQTLQRNVQHCKNRYLVDAYPGSLNVKSKQHTKSTHLHVSEGSAARATTSRCLLDQIQQDTKTNTPGR